MSPLVMQWSTGARADVEFALQDGVVIVNHSCEGVKVLQDCRVAGEYGYRGLTPKSADALIEGSDNIQASFGGGPFSFGGGIDRSAKLDLSYMLVGKRATVRSSVHRGELEGGKFCEGATHFVKRVDIGAWTMVAGKDVTAGLAAKVMSQGIDASSSNKELRSKKDGDPKSCSGATRDDEGPPGGCGALIRVTMAPIERWRRARQGRQRRQAWWMTARAVRGFRLHRRRRVPEGCQQGQGHPVPTQIVNSISGRRALS